MFEINYLKKLACLSCTMCRKEEKELLRQQLEQQEVLRHEQAKIHQERIFNEARQQMLQ